MLLLIAIIPCDPSDVMLFNTLWMSISCVCVCRWDFKMRGRVGMECLDGKNRNDLQQDNYYMYN